MNRQRSIAWTLTLLLTASCLCAPTALGQIQTTSSSFHGEATYSQKEQFFFETRVLAEIMNDLGTVTIYDQTFTNSYTELTDHQEFASGDSVAQYASEKAAAEARVPYPQPGNLFVEAIPGLPYSGTPGPPDITAAIDEAIMLLSAAAPGAAIDRTDDTTTSSTRSLHTTASARSDTDVTETYLTTQETFIQTTVLLSADATTSVPEPQAIAIWTLLGLGLMAVCLFRRRRLTSK